ncbi:MAG: YesU family protein [Chloroflexota bacterium]
MTQFRLSDLVYENDLSREADVKGFRLEGEANIDFPNGRLHMENSRDASEGQKSNFVFWCPEDFPADVSIAWDFWPLREPGLCILFFSAMGQRGVDIFDAGLKSRTGEYDQYHHGDINAFHVSYFRRRWPQERAFHTCNLRKSYGFHMVTQGADPLPPVADATPPYHIQVIKCGPHIAFYINDLPIFSWQDDGETYGPLLQGGKIGFRQMAPLIGEYANLKIHRATSMTE